MAELLVTAEHVKAAKAVGACPEQLPKAGTPISGLSFIQAMWAEERLPELVESLRLSVPLWAMVRSGYGHGYGSGYGHGSGYGDGDGYGSGSGYGDGDGYGSGYGHGYGDGYA